VRKNKAFLIDVFCVKTREKSTLKCRDCTKKEMLEERDQN